MNRESVPGALGEVRSATTSGGGSALTTTSSFVELPDGTAFLFLDIRNGAGGMNVIKIQKSPYLLVLKATDQLATRALTTDATVTVQDARKTNTLDLSLFDVAANKNFLYIGAAQPFRGVNVSVANANAVGSVLTAKYWNGIAWTAVTGFADATSSVGATMAVNGNVTWTVPADWTPATLAAIEAAGTVPQAAMLGVYWMRWEVSVKLGATVKLSALLGMNRSTLFEELVADSNGTFGWEERIYKGFGGLGALELQTDVGTANLIADVATLPGFGFAYNT